jgi:hypothetical protein
VLRATLLYEPRIRTHRPRIKKNKILLLQPELHTIFLFF